MFILITEHVSSDVFFLCGQTYCALSAKCAIHTAPATGVHIDVD